MFVRSGSPTRRLWSVRGGGLARSLGFSAGGSKGVEGGAREGCELADPALVLSGEIGSARLVGELKETVVAATVAADRRGEPAAQRRVVGGLVTESGPARMGLHFFLGQADDLARCKLDPV
jgi:hypothetical protein